MRLIRLHIVNYLYHMYIVMFSFAVPHYKVIVIVEMTDCDE